MHKVTYTLVAGVAFWLGVASGVGQERPPPFKRVTPPERINLSLFPCNKHGRIEYERTCRAQARSALIKKE